MRGGCGNSVEEESMSMIVKLGRAWVRRIYVTVCVAYKFGPFIWNSFSFQRIRLNLQFKSIRDK